jgi:exopolysaccharide biosynthesis polyprenyl glycosylphosphotransferase
LLAGDAIVALGGLVLGFWLRYKTPVGALGIDVPGARFLDYLPLLLLGVAFLVYVFAQLGLYDGRVLLRKQHNLNELVRGTAFWVVVYLAFSLFIRFQPPISRLFVLVAAVVTLLLLWVWREAFYHVLTRPRLLPRLQRRVGLLGWNAGAHSLVGEVQKSRAHPLAIAGCIDDGSGLAGCPLPVLGHARDLAAVLERERLDVVIAAHLDIPADQLRDLTAICEHAYVEWKVVPAAFPIFLSGLRLQTIGGIPVIGVEDLPIARLFNRVVKRGQDIIGATAGLVLSAPVVALLALLIKRESPGGPVFFRQQRIGAGHSTFTLYKLRSMAPTAAASDDAQQSTRADDPRLLRIGAFMRRWNLDELPQYWNVLRGDMSLIGPRPERPHHVDQLARLIPHYLPRHLVKPGMTGWAQVNGLRGATDLEQRVRYDIYYIENWSFWLDLQIMLLTFLRWKSPA